MLALRQGINEPAYPDFEYYLIIGCRVLCHTAQGLITLIDNLDISGMDVFEPDGVIQNPDHNIVLRIQATPAKQLRLELIRLIKQSALLVKGLDGTPPNYVMLFHPYGILCPMGTMPP